MFPESGGVMSRPSKNYPPEFRERAVRMVLEITPDHPSQWAAIKLVAARLGVGSAEPVRKWVVRAEIDSGQRAGLTSEEHAEVKRLKRENSELRRANEILSQPRFSSRPSSTGHCNASELHQRISGPLWRHESPFSLREWGCPLPSCQAAKAGFSWLGS
jgi:transposase